MGACRLTGINPCIQIDPEASVEDAARLMSSSGVHHVLVVGDRGVVGVFTVRGMIRSLRD